MNEPLNTNPQLQNEENKPKYSVKFLSAPTYAIAIVIVLSVLFFNYKSRDVEQNLVQIPEVATSTENVPVEFSDIATIGTSSLSFSLKKVRPNYATKDLELWVSKKGEDILLLQNINSGTETQPKFTEDKDFVYVTGGQEGKGCAPGRSLYLVDKESLVVYSIENPTEKSFTIGVKDKQKNLSSSKKVAIGYEETSSVPDTFEAMGSTVYQFKGLKIDDEVFYNFNLTNGIKIERSEMCGDYFPIEIANVRFDGANIVFDFVSRLDKVKGKVFKYSLLEQKFVTSSVVSKELVKVDQVTDAGSFKAEAVVKTTEYCGEKGCFEEKVKSCSPSKLNAEIEGFAAVEYEILGKGLKGCSMSFMYTKFYYDDPMSMANKKMICDVDQNRDFETVWNEIFSGVTNGKVVCGGELYKILSQGVSQ